MGVGTGSKNTVPRIADAIYSQRIASFLNVELPRLVQSGEKHQGRQAGKPVGLDVPLKQNRKNIGWSRWHSYYICLTQSNILLLDYQH